MIKRAKKLIQPISDIVFPPVCACCGDLLMDRQLMVCELCLSTRFERTDFAQGDILPDSVEFQFSLWNFDKYGYLQHLLHKLKYDHCTTIGVQMGKEAGRALLNSGIISDIENWCLLAVPLHRKKRRQRGYNQSEEIARGLSQISGIQMLSVSSVERVKYTRTQTGLNSNQRQKNISGAFQINTPQVIQGRHILIVDDVYTTGATTFELAQEIFDCNGLSCGILTIAKA